MIDIVGYENQYAITDNGQIWSYKTNKFLKPTLSTSGYPAVNLHKDGTRQKGSIHRLVAQAYINNPESKLEVNHIDGDKLNNAISNLEWCTRKENVSHAHKMGLYNTKAVRDGHDRHIKFDDITVIMLRNIYKFTGKPIHKIASAYKASYGAMYNAIKGKGVYANF
jgi:hypothetical protein